LCRSMALIFGVMYAGSLDVMLTARLG